MILERRDFLKLLGGAAGAVGLGSCGRLVVPDRLVELALRGPGLETTLNTVCGLCEAGCGMTVRLVDGLPVGVKGNRRHPLNRGGLCPVGHAALDVLYAPERLPGPQRRRPDGGFELATWEEALSEIGGRLAELAAAGEGRRFAFWGSHAGTLFRQLARRFGAALGSPNIGFEEESGILPFFLSQGLNSVPGFDLANADAVLSVGLDLFEDGPTPVHAISSLSGARSTEERAALLFVGTRLSPSASKAEQFLGVDAGAHAAAALGIAHVLVREGRYDRRFVDDHTFGFEDWTDDSGERRLGFRRLLLERYYPDRAAGLAGCEPGALIRMARRLARARAPLAIWGGEAVAGSQGTRTALAVHSLNALLGAFGRRGGIVLPPPISFAPLDPLPRTGGEGIFPALSSMAIGGRDPVRSLAESEDLEVLFLAGANPVHDSPAGEDLARVLAEIPLVVAFSPFRDETAAAADWILPPSLFLETWDEVTTPSGVAFSTLSISQPVVDPFFDTRHAGDVLLELSRRLGGDRAAALPWETYEGYLKDRLEGLLVSGQGSVISGSFEESWVHFLEERGWRFLEHADRNAFWRDLVREGGWWSPIAAFDDWERLFSTPSGRFEFHSLALENQLAAASGESGAGSGGTLAVRRGLEALGLEVPAELACLPHFEPAGGAGEVEEGELRLVPFRPITARGRLGTRSRMVLEMFGYPVLAGWQTWVELAPETAHDLHVDEGDRVALESERGAIEAVVRIEPGATPGCAHVPVGLGRRDSGGPAAGVGANPMRLAAAGHDPLSGSLATAGTRVELRLLERRTRGGPRPLDGGHG